MSHLNAGFIVGGVLLAIGVGLFFVTRRKGDDPVGVGLSILFIVAGGLEIITTIVARSASRSDAGTVQVARIVETTAGPRIVTMDVIEHSDPISFLAGLLLTKGHGGPRGLGWREQRLNVFDLASGKRLLRTSLNDAVEHPALDDLGGFVIVNDTRLLDASTGEDVDLSVLGPRIRAANPSVADIRTSRYDSATGCIEVRTEAFKITLDPRRFAVATGSCRVGAGLGTYAAKFDSGASLSIKHTARPLPPGATPLPNVAEEGFIEPDAAPGASRSKVYENPRFALDSRTGEVLFVGNPRAAILLYGTKALTAATISSSGAVGWEASLPAGLTDLSLIGGEFVAVGNTKTIAIDVASRHTREIEVSGG